MIDAIDAILPQTQCRECGYAGCRPYATALVEEKAAINLCPPGGVKVLKQLGELLQQDSQQYINSFITRTPSTAKIIEADCIGCTKCIQACPVDAIVGAGKLMHTVLSDECTGCGLCVEPCPVDCIIMQDLAEPRFNPEKSRQRFHARNARLEKQNTISAPEQKDQQSKRDFIREAILRAQAKKENG